MNFKKESFGLSSFVIVVETELNALKSNKHIIYSSLLTPILYYVFYAIGIQSTFGDIYIFMDSICPFCHLHLLAF